MLAASSNLAMLCDVCGDALKPSTIDPLASHFYGRCRQPASMPTGSDDTTRCGTRLLVASSDVSTISHMTVCLTKVSDILSQT
jgi:hypothetical protein